MHYGPGIIFNQSDALLPLLDPKQVISYLKRGEC